METSYIVYHWWNGDKVSDPQWVHTGTYVSLGVAIGVMEKTKKLGFKKIAIQKITKEYVWADSLENLP